MKKRTIILLVVMVLLVSTLTACETAEDVNESVSETAAEMSNFKMIDGKDCLAYSLDTRIVYYMFTISVESGYGGYGYAYFAPYISENGNFCRYINDEIVEITETNADN